MIIQQQSNVKILEPLIKIIKDRESVYFEALSFVIRNIESSFNDFDQIYIFTKFLNSTTEADHQLVKIQELFLNELSSQDQSQIQGIKISNSSKQMMRLRSRVLQIMEQAIERARKSIFGDNGGLTIAFTRFKTTLHKILKQDLIDLYDFASHFISFSKVKYRKQIAKLKSYLARLRQGDQVSLRDMFAANNHSDASSSPDQKLKFKKTNKILKKSNKEQTSQTDSPHKRPSTKKVTQSGTKTKKNLTIKNMKKDEIIEKIPKQKKSKKQMTAAQLLKYYAMMELNKKQFLEDYVFQKQAEDQQRKRLMAVLMDKNKFNNQQIKQYQTKCSAFNPSQHLIPNPSSDENQRSLTQRNQSSGGSRMSLRTSFIISKRKPSFTFESPSERSEGQFTKNEIPFSKTIRNFSTRRPSPNTVTTARPKQPSRSKKIFVVKSPMIFEDQIPKVEFNNNSQWIQQPLTGSKDSKPSQRKNQHIRLKKRNNPCPLDNNFIPDSYQYTQYPV